METTEIIAALRVVATVDPHQGRGGPEVVVDKELCADAANRLESLDKLWKITRLQRDQARQMRERAERLLGEAQMELLELRRNTEAVVHAHWFMRNPEIISCGYCCEFTCSNCCGIVELDHAVKECDYERCPHCGAHMDEEVAE